ncbi:MAG: pseudouridine synthase [Candidatus Absconditabacteria bacterium]|nr:pseudouridine synthase [Candidatus Absconditabacteria bacterium]
MKLREFLQQQGLSRRNITASIDAGNVFVNDKKVESYGEMLNDGDVVKFENTVWTYTISNDKKKSEFIIFYKPIGYVCSKSDPHNATIYEILPKEYHSWYYIGRLDSNSRGLVLMTNDAKMVDQYEHPRHGITKEYLVTLNKSFRQQDAQTCLDGIDDQEENLKAIECQILDDKIYEKYKKFLLEDVVKNSSCVVRMVLNEGKKRHIRRMMSTMRYHVEDLVRIREGEFELGDLKEGEIKGV